MKKKIVVFAVMMILTITETSAALYKYIDNKGISFAWSTKDIVGLYTIAGNRIRTTVHALDEADSRSVQLTGNGWGLVGNATYYGYYPYSSMYYETSQPINALPVTYLSQEQSDNNNADHLAKYDFMYGLTRTTATSADFALNHFGSIVRISWQAREGLTVKEVSLEADQEVIPIEATMDLTSQTLNIVKYSRMLSLKTKDIELEDGDTLVAYIMIPSFDLSKEELSLKIKGETGEETVYKMRGTCFKAGYVYPLDINISNKEDAKDVTNINSDIEKTIQSSLRLPCATAEHFPIDTENKISMLHIGDVNIDGVIDINDAKLIVDYYLGKTNTIPSMTTADVNNDGNINIADANMIINMLDKIVND